MTPHPQPHAASRTLMSAKSRKGNANRGCAAVNSTGLCTLNSLKLDCSSFCSFVLCWTVGLFLGCCSCHISTHPLVHIPWPVCRVSNVNLNTKKTKQRNTSLSVTPRQTPLPQRPPGANCSSWPTEILLFLLALPPHTHTHTHRRFVSVAMFYNEI